ncbi:MULTISPECIES: GH-E family nuclease [Pseudomonas]|uniref:GH-E family nuclease n=1 Tax=Pseudomonas TaxID=286 RepID=UPI002100C0E1|nr:MULTISPECIES: GH-E family nuclease [Pseudomonas]WBM31148.1 GH-E family nuclease [Pseudomonas sp. NY11382]
MSDPIQLDTLVVQVHEVPLRKMSHGPDRIFVQTDGTGKVLVDFADGPNEWGKSLELTEAQYEDLRQEAFHKELADLDDIPKYTDLYPSLDKELGGASTTPNGNTLGRVNGETAASGDDAKHSNPEVESETPAEGFTDDEILDAVQMGLDVIGLIPIVGELADVANAGISLSRGDYAGAALSLLSAIPFAGYLGTAGKIGRHGAKAVAEASAKAAKEGTERATREISSDAAGEVAERTGAKVAASPKRLRDQYLGRTPGKSSRTGREVQERMRAEGKLKPDPLTGEPIFQASNGNWYDLSKADMAHNTDAVSWWNKTGRKFGAKSPEVRKWMLDSRNYTMDHYSLNRSAGARLGETYKPPLK